jgi:hypothetical protein
VSGDEVWQDSKPSLAGAARRQEEARGKTAASQRPGLLDARLCSKRDRTSRARAGWLH